MAQRFNKEPINLIHRIPSQKQIDEARPAPTPYGQLFLEITTKCWRKTIDFLARVTRYEDEAMPSPKPKATPQDSGVVLSPMAQTGTQPEPGIAHMSNETGGVMVQPREADHATVASFKEGAPQQQSVTATLVQPEAISELRSFLITQQDQIAHLSSEIAQLKSLVVSQQQVLVHLGKELEADSYPALATGMGPNPAKRGRIARKNLTTKEKPLPPQEPESQSLTL
ncbi:MAG: hypothetical protein CV090_16065 [Nitrospira sp. WS238]|nr:hypothetical protein [Nitrospira sp. WS238]